MTKQGRYHPEALRVICSDGGSKNECGAVYLVFTPFQYLNALEARQQLKEPPGYLIIVNADHQAEYIWPMLDCSEWYAVFAVDAVGRPDAPIGGSAGRINYYRWQRRARSALEYLARILRHPKRLYIGNYLAPLALHFAPLLEPERLILLDDGTQTLAINRWRSGIRQHPALTERFKLALRYRLIGLDLRDFDQVTFFTMYDLELRPGDELIRNDYARLRSLMKEKSISNEIFLLGQSLVEEEILSERDYTSYIEKIVNRTRGDRLVYIPHKRETADKLDCIRRTFGIEVRRFPLPIEAQLASSRELPKAVYSFYSTALNTCRILFGDTMSITAVVVNPSLMKAEINESAAIYQDMSLHAGRNFEVIELEG